MVWWIAGVGHHHLGMCTADDGTVFHMFVNASQEAYRGVMYAVSPGMVALRAQHWWRAGCQWPRLHPPASPGSNIWRWC